MSTLQNAFCKAALSRALVLNRREAPSADGLRHLVATPGKQPQGSQAPGPGDFSGSSLRLVAFMSNYKQFRPRNRLSSLPSWAPLQSY